MEEIKKLIIDLVTRKQGCKKDILFCDPWIALACVKANILLSEVIDDLIKYEELIEIEYILPSKEYKEFLLPKGSQVPGHFC